ncbi:MAG: GAF domain-containing protein [Candidatus Hydrogenedentota bacterium]
MAEERLKYLNIGFKVIGISLLNVILAIIIVFIVYYIDKEKFEQEIIRRTELIPKIMALSNAKQIAENDISSLRDAVANTIGDIGEQGEIVYVYILDGDGVPLAEEFSGKITRAEVDEIEQKVYKKIRVKTELADQQAGLHKLRTADGEITNYQEIPPQLTRTERRLKSSGRDVLDVIVPININNYSIVWGAIRVGFSVDSFYDFVQLRNFILLISIVLISSVIIASLFISKNINDGTEEIISDIKLELERKYKHEIDKMKKEVETGESGEEGPQPLTGQEFFNLLDIAKRIGATLDLSEVLQMAVGSIVRLMKVRIMTLFLLDSATNELVGKIGYDENGVISESELSTIRVKVGQSDIGLTAEFGTTTIVDDPQPGVALIAALVAKGRVIGVFMIRNKINNKPFLKKDKLIARLASTLLANAINNALEYENLKTGVV